jgi:HAD superfamily hydrolase (TIGR01490 family)
MPYFVLRQLYLIGETRYQHQRVQQFAGIFKGWSTDDMNALNTWLVQEKFTYREDVLTILKRHHQQGSNVVLVSTLFTSIVQKVCEVMEFDGAIGTEQAVEKDKLTGKIIGDVCVGPRKVDFLRRYLLKHHPGVTLKECAAYADSYSDAPMLAVVGMPVAVYPDKNLKEAAIEQKWRIHETL